MGSPEVKPEAGGGMGIHGGVVVPMGGECVDTLAAPVSSRPDQEAIATAQAQLHEIFDGEGGKEADEMYRRGLHDLTHGRADSPDALFYIDTQRIIGIASYAYDRPPQAG